MGKHGVRYHRVCQKPKQGFPENIVLNLKEELLSIELADSEEESRIGKAAGAGCLVD